LLTARASREDKIQGLQAGADDYITKPFDPQELRARVQVGIRVLELQGALAQRVRELEEALSRVKQLQGLLPICSYCKKIRNDRNYWQQVEGYITEHSEAQFSHGICPDCYAQYVRPELERMQGQAGKNRE
jgi:response regulator RpfG family c-di-GMP phosphodiesterase